MIDQIINNVCLPIEEETEIELLVLSCPGSCATCKINCVGDVGKALHKLYSKYLLQKKIIKESDDEIWKKIKNK